MEREYPLKAIESGCGWFKVPAEEEIEGWISVKLVWGSVDPGMDEL